MYIPKDWQRLCAWLKTDLGNYVLYKETISLSQLLNDLFGNNILIIGEPEFCALTSILQQQYKNITKFNIHPFVTSDSTTVDAVLINSRQDKLPIDSDSMDVVILPHSLEIIVNPYEIIRESYRVLRPEGRIIIIGFAPYGIWHAWKIFAQLFNKAPWRNAFIAPKKIIEFLTDLGMEESQLLKYCCNLPINSKKFLNKLLFLESIGNMLPFKTGNIYTIYACKRVITLTPEFVMQWAQGSLNDDLAKIT